MSQLEKKKKDAPKPSRARKSGSIAWGINSDHFSTMLLSFLVIDGVFFVKEFGFVVELYKSGVAAPDYVSTVMAEIAKTLMRIFNENFVLFCIEGAILLGTLIFGSAKIRYELRSLDLIAADTAAVLDDSVLRMDENSFHDLENAIEHISPLGEGTRIRTGNRELEGLEKAVNNLLERMRASYRQQARFVSDASHELRTPIAVIQGYAGMLDRWGKQDEKILEESIEAIKSEAQHMNKLVEQLLFLARGDDGRQQMKPESFDLSKLIQEVYEESDMIDDKHEYFLSAPEPVIVVGDQDMLKQTARILVENSVKYSPDGERITLKAGLTANGEPSFTVQDSGVGMATEDVPHIFERFYRADSSRTRETGGTGLGLAIAKWIVDRHGGWFEVFSREGLGTRISVVLPKPSDT